MWAQFTQWVSNISVSRSFCYLRLPVNICWFSLVILTRGYHFYRFTFWTRLFTIGNMAKAKRSEFVQIIQNENESFFLYMQWSRHCFEYVQNYWAINWISSIFHDRWHDLHKTHEVHMHLNFEKRLKPVFPHKIFFVCFFWPFFIL